MLGLVWLLFMRKDFINTESTILVLSENSSCYLNLIFFVFSVFFKTKKLETKYAFIVLLIFQNKKQFSKIVNNLCL